MNIESKIVDGIKELIKQEGCAFNAHDFQNYVKPLFDDWIDDSNWEAIVTEQVRNVHDDTISTAVSDWCYENIDSTVSDVVENGDQVKDATEYWMDRRGASYVKQFLLSEEGKEMLRDVLKDLIVVSIKE